MLGNGVVGILYESSNVWERRVPLTPAHCARLLLSGKGKSGVERIIVQPSTKRIYHDQQQYEDVGCEVSNDLSECGLILGIKQPKLDMILPDRAYAFFSHTHKAQSENMPLFLLKGFLYMIMSVLLEMMGKDCFLLESLLVELDS